MKRIALGRSDELLRPEMTRALQIRKLRSRMKLAPRDSFHKATKLAMLVVIQGIYFYYLEPLASRVAMATQAEQAIKNTSFLKQITKPDTN